jgi:phage terminase large subunit-like protein
VSAEGLDVAQATAYVDIAAWSAIAEAGDGAAAAGQDYVNSSATGGYLAPIPSGPQPLTDEELEDFFQAMIVGITGVAGTLVRPFWQIEPAEQPQFGTTWMAFGVEVSEEDVYAVNLHLPGYDQLQRHEILDVKVRAYGPLARSTLDRLRDGLQIGQNREPLLLAGMGLVSTDKARTVPTVMKERYLFAVETTVRIRRQIVRNYPVLDVASAAGTITRDTGATTAFNAP